MLVRLYGVVQVAAWVYNLPPRVNEQYENGSTACAGDENMKFGDNFLRKMTINQRSSFPDK
jgi:hypothetical protein